MRATNKLKKIIESVIIISYRKNVFHQKFLFVYSWNKRQSIWLFANCFISVDCFVFVCFFFSCHTLFDSILLLMQIDIEVNNLQKKDGTASPTFRLLRINLDLSFKWFKKWMQEISFFNWIWIIRCGKNDTLEYYVWKLFYCKNAIFFHKNSNVLTKILIN